MIENVDGDRYTAKALEAGVAGAGGGEDWTANERTALRAILGIPTVGTTPESPTAGALYDIVADTNELQGDWANNGRLDLLLDTIVADTNELQTDWANGGRLDLLLDTAAAGGGGL